MRVTIITAAAGNGHAVLLSAVIPVPELSTLIVATRASEATSVLDDISHEQIWQFANPTIAVLPVQQ